MNCEKAEAGSGEQFAAWGLHALAGEVKLQLLAGQLHSRRFKKIRTGDAIFPGFPRRAELDSGGRGLSPAASWAGPGDGAGP